MWGKIKAALFNWFFLILFTCGAFVSFFTYASEMPRLWEQNEAKVVEDIYTSKGLYFGLQYYVEFSEGAGHRISKGDFLSLEKGDSFRMFMNSFSLMDFLPITAIMLLATGGFLSMAYHFAFEIFGQTRWFGKLESKREQLVKLIISPFKKGKKTLDILKRIAMLALILSLLIPLLLIAKNVVYKMVPFGKTNVVAEVLDYEKQDISSPKGPTITTYTLIYEYKDKDSKLHKTEKNVSAYTYNIYKQLGVIPITYRNNYPYDTFINNSSMKEFLGPVFSIPTFLFAFIGYFVYFLIKKYIEMWGISFIRHE